MRAFLPAGAELASWLAAGQGASRPPLLGLWGYRWRAFWFDRNWRLQEMLYPAQTFEGEEGRNLIFVLGFWRSGTTLLHELLALGPGMAAPRTWQCLNPSAFRLARPPTSSASVLRPMDGMVVDADSPQEDEFAILARGAPSAYRAWLDPRRWEEALPSLAQDTWLSLPADKWFTDWRHFLGWCMADDATMLVVKSPNHVFRLRAIHAAWPKARIVWTLRDPADTWFSNRKMWRAMATRYGVCNWRGEDLDRLLFHAFVEYAAALRWAIDTLGFEQLAFVDFQRLGCATQETMQTLTFRLELGPWEAWHPLLQGRLEESATHAPETYPMHAPLPADTRALLQEIGHLHQRILTSDPTVDTR